MNNRSVHASWTSSSSVHPALIYLQTSIFMDPCYTSSARLPPLIAPHKIKLVIRHNHTISESWKTQQHFFGATELQRSSSSAVKSRTCTVSPACSTLTARVLQLGEWMQIFRTHYPTSRKTATALWNCHMRKDVKRQLSAENRAIVLKANINIVTLYSGSTILMWK